VLGLIKSIKLSQGRLVELGASFADKTGHVTLEAAAKPHKDHRVAATCVLPPMLAGEPHLAPDLGTGETPQAHAELIAMRACHGSKTVHQDSSHSPRPNSCMASCLHELSPDPGS
jgi:hypothetical protein